VGAATLTAFLGCVLLCGCGLQVSPVMDDRQHGAVADRRLIVQSDVEWSVVVGEGRPIYGRGNRTIDLPDRGSVCVIISLLAGTGRLRAWIVPAGESKEIEEPQASIRLCSLPEPAVNRSRASASKAGQQTTACWVGPKMTSADRRLLHDAIPR
jgi:hypothetical protein